MVKDSIPRPGPLPRPKRDRKAPTRKKAVAGADSIRSDRLMMRMHEDLVKLLDARSAESGESRSRYIEKLLIAFLRMDPRNPRMDPWGRIDPTAPAPTMAHNQIIFGEKWSRWCDLNERLGYPKPPPEWLADERGYVLWAERALPDDPNRDIEDD